MKLAIKETFAGAHTRRARERAVMSRLREALEHRRRPERRPPSRGRERDPAAWHSERLWTGFRSIARIPRVGGDAMITLAYSSMLGDEDLLVSRRALSALDGHLLHTMRAGRSIELLEEMLQHDDRDIFAAAFSHLVWLCDGLPTPSAVGEGVAGSSAGQDVKRRLIAAGLSRLDESAESLTAGDWKPRRLLTPTAKWVLPFDTPPDREAAYLAFAALDGDGDTLGKLFACQIDAELMLLCHVLAAPRVQPADAKRMFGWYARHPEGWEAAPRLTRWQLAVVGVLVSILPKLPEARLAWYEQHLVHKGIGKAATFAARHRIERLPSPLPGVPWLRPAELKTDGLAAVDALRLWRTLGRVGSGDRDAGNGLLAALLAAVPRERGLACRQQLACTVLAMHPLGEEAVEARVLHDWCRDSNPCIARAALRRLLSMAADAGDYQELLSDLPEHVSAEVATELFHRSGQGVAAPRGLRAALGERCMFRAVHGKPEQLHAAVLKTLRAESAQEPAWQRRAALAAARSLPTWSESLLRAIAECTTARDAETRRAAYAALRSAAKRDTRAATLAEEASFDVSSMVRSLR
ncbi:MAG: hypothetical protein AB8H80_07045 [Planctomycetota bacterium]